MRLRHALVAIAALSALVFIACGGGDGDAPDTTSTLPPPTATTTAAPLVDVPGRANAFADYPGVVGIYLTVAGPGVLGAPCLSELIAGWAMTEPDGAPLTPEERCLVGNTAIWRIAGSIYSAISGIDSMRWPSQSTTLKPFQVTLHLLDRRYAWLARVRPWY